MSMFSSRRQLLAQMASVEAEIQAQDRESRISEEAQDRFHLAELDAKFEAYSDANHATFPFVREFLAKELATSTKSLSRVIQMAKQSSPDLGDLLLAIFEANILATVWGNKTLIEEERSLKEELESEEGVSIDPVEDDDTDKEH